MQKNKIEAVAQERIFPGGEPYADIHFVGIIKNTEGPTGSYATGLKQKKLNLVRHCINISHLFSKFKLVKNN